ncbi:MAG: tetratricopeptide repeat protein, partial [Calditrichaceae bacterium]
MCKTSFSLTLFLLLICSILANASESSGSEYVNEGWQQLAQNNFSEAENTFLKAIEKDEKDSRPYLALSYLMQLKEKNEIAWEWYNKALKNLENPYPYVFAAYLTKRGLLIPRVNKDKGLIKIFPSMTEEADETGVLRAGAMEMMGRYHQEYGDIELANEYFNKLNAIDEWTLIGPFENISASGYDKIFDPELEYKESEIYEGKNGIPVKWFRINKIRRDKWIDFTRYFAQNGAIFYGNSFIYSPEKQIVQIRVGTSGSLKTFLNDEEIISCLDENNNDLDTYNAETELQQGWNRLLIKCGYSEITQCNFLVRITDANGYKIDNLKIATDAKSYPAHAKVSVKHIRNFAELYFEKQIKKHPDYIENYLLLSDCYLRNDKAIEAELVLRDAEKRMPDCVLIKNQLLEAYVRGEKYDEIDATMTRIFSLYPDIPSVLEQKFSEYFKNEDLDQLENITNRYAKLLPQSATALLMQVNIELKKGQIDQALAILKNAYEKYPNNWDIVYLSALFSIRTTQNYDGAIKIYKDFIKQRRTEAAYIQLGNTYFTASQIDNFENTFNEMLKLDPAGTGLYFGMANVFTQIQDYEKAEKYMKECLELCPYFSVYWAKLGEIKQGAGDKDEAIQAYRTALKYSATDYNSRMRLRELEGKNSIFSQFKSIDINLLIKNAPEADAYPNDCAVYLLDDRKRVVYDKGASEIQNEVLLKVFNADGIDEFKEYWLPYNSYSEKLIIEKAV